MALGMLRQSCWLIGMDFARLISVSWAGLGAKGGIESVHPLHGPELRA
jgi:hypothetical protein